MSLFGAMNTAVSGLTSQSAAFSNISDNVANSQTVGFKGVDTSFIDYLTVSNAQTNESGAAVAKPSYTNDVQGSITQSTDATALAIAGPGFFPVSQQTGQQNGAATFSPQTYYTRAGDFTLDTNGYLVNSAGYTLNGYQADPATGAIVATSTAPIQINKSAFNPVPTANLSLSANLPATPTAGTPIQSQIQVYDALGSSHTVTLNWTQTSANTWSVGVNVPDDTTAANRGTATVTFGAASGNPVPEGTVGSVATPTGSVVASAYTAGQPATLSFTTNFGSGAQTINVNLGTFGQSNGLTQFAGTQYDPRGLTQDGIRPGAYSGVSIQQNGDVVASYDNGQTRTIAQVPVVTFASPDALQRQNGQAFTATTQSGIPVVKNAGASGAGTLSTSSVESSNVDIASEFSKLIVAQSAYSANTKMVTTAEQLLQQTINMKQ